MQPPSTTVLVVSARAFAVKPRAFGAPLSGYLTAQHGRANCCPCRDVLFCGQCLTGGVRVFSVKGRAAIEAYWTAVAEHYHNVRLTTLDAAQLGPDFIREIGKYHAEPKIAGSANLTGKFVFIWKKVGSDWKIWTDIWTSHSGQTYLVAKLRTPNENPPSRDEQ